MTPAEADQRIILSRRTLAGYVRMIAEDVHPANGTMVLIAEELTLLEAIAEEHPGKAQKIAALVAEWIALRDGMKQRLH